jgi:hypothetical protein
MVIHPPALPEKASTSILVTAILSSALGASVYVTLRLLMRKI